MIVKVCGMTRDRDAKCCAELGADLLGFIFHPPSPRCVEPSFPAGLDLPGVRKVGVFVRQSVEEVRRIMDEGSLDLAQLHGGQDADFCRAIGPERVVRVFWPERYASPNLLSRDLDAFADAASFFLLDAGRSGGGHGRGFDPSLVRKLKAPRPMLMAGGLGPETLAEALNAARPAGVDLNSGVESAPGLKDRVLLEACFKIVNEWKTKGI